MSKISRRSFMGGLSAGLVGMSAAASYDPAQALSRINETRRESSRSVADLARDEHFWRPIQNAFSVDRSMVNLNNGGVCPSPASVMAAMKRYLDFSNHAPAQTMWRVLEPQKETVRARLAQNFGCSPEEIALTRNASEGLQICQLGFDLKAGDEVLTTDQDYPRMLATFRQRERREGIVLKTFPVPPLSASDEDVVAAFERNISPRTKLILMCHIVNLTGRILPVKKVVQMARAKGIPVIVDGAHAFAHFQFTRDDLDCDYYATSLHKWLFAPHGTGMLYVRRDKIKKLWALTPAEERLDEDIRKFEEIGTHPAANTLATAEALTFYEGVGAALKEARLRYLTAYWAKRLTANPRVTLNTDLSPGRSCALANFRVEGIKPMDLLRHLSRKHFVTTLINHPDCTGQRITPCLYTTLPELDRFCDVVEQAIKNGVPT